MKNFCCGIAEQLLREGMHRERMLLGYRTSCFTLNDKATTLPEAKSWRSQLPKPRMGRKAIAQGKAKIGQADQSAALGKSPSKTLFQALKGRDVSVFGTQHSHSPTSATIPLVA